MEWTNVTFGNRQVVSISIGNTIIWPLEDYIILPDTGSTALTAATTGYISNISASTTAWTVESNSTSWLTVQKINNTQAQYTISANSSAAERTGILTFRCGDATATYTLRQLGAAAYITLSPTYVEVGAAATAGTIAVSTNIPTSDWAVYTISPGFIAIKNNGNVSWTASENTGSTARSGFITVSGLGVSVYTEIYQAASYVFYLLTTTPITISSASTSFNISLISKLDNQAIEPTYAIGANTMNIQLDSMQQGGTTGQYNYVFSCNANSTTSAKTAHISFGQQRTGGITYIGADITQRAKYVQPTIDGVTTAATYNEWVLGTVAAGRQAFPAGTFDINGLVVVTPNPITSDHTAHIGKLYYQTGPVTTGASPTSYTIENQDYSIPSGSTFTMSGVTYNGKIIVTPYPRLQVNGSVTGFTVN